MESVLADQKDIAEVVTLSGKFSILAAAMNATDFFESLKDDGPYTVFAPTDEAFASLPVGTLEYLFKSANKAILTYILRYHVVQGKIGAGEVARCNEIKTLNGEVLSTGSRYGKIMVDLATITMQNIACSNGIIHAIDQVAVPKRWL